MSPGIVREDRSARNHTDSPPTDDGIRLATLSRGQGHELRIRWCAFKGHHYLDLREWSANPQSGEWWPVKGKGITIKARELAEVMQALEGAKRLTGTTPSPERRA